MDRNEIIILTKKLNLGTINLEDMTKIIVEYCIEKGKDKFLSQHFAMILLKTGIIIDYFLIALEYYQKKFSICTLTDAKGKVITIF